MTDPPSNVDTQQEPDRYTAMPRWVKVLGIITIALIVTLLVMLLTRGPHRPGMPGMQHGLGGAAPVTNAAALAGHAPSQRAHQ